MTRRVIILSGVSGSGKTTLAKRYWPTTPARDFPVAPHDPGTTVHVSADHYFYVYNTANAGRYGYAFDPSKLEHAHGACLQQFVEAAQNPHVETIVVDNTNTTVAEIAPYYAVARAYGFDVSLVTVENESDGGWTNGVSNRLNAAYNQCKHGVSLDGIEAQDARLLTLELPRFWNIERVHSSELIAEPAAHHLVLT